MFVHGRLSRPIRHRIIRVDRKTRNADLRIRCRVVLKVAEGTSTHSAALALGCAPSTAWRAVARFKAEGESGLLDRRAQYGSLKVTRTYAAGSGRSWLAAPKITASSGAPGRWRCWQK